MAKKMITKISYSYNDKKPDYEIRMMLDLKRFEKQYSQAQYELDNMVMQSMIPYMPKQTGTFINVTQAMSSALAGSGMVVAAAPPMGRFLYEGKLMVGEHTKSAWAEKGERKDVTMQNLDYYRGANPDAQSQWFDAAKDAHADKWVKKAKKIAGGGRHG